MPAKVGGVWRSVFSSAPAARIIRPPLAGLGLGIPATGVVVWATHSPPIAAFVFLVIWMGSLGLWTRALGSLPGLGTPDDPVLVHERLRLGLVLWATAGLYVLIGEFLALLAVSATVEAIVAVVEVTVLGGTIAYLGVFARFTAAAFTADMDRLVRETRASGDALGESFLAATKALGDAFAANTERLLQKLDERGHEQARILVGMTDALNEMASLLKSHGKVAEETRKLGEEALRVQRETAETRVKLEEERVEARRQEEAAARLRMMPRLGIRVRVSSGGLFVHHVFVDVANGGMTGQDLEVNLFVDEAAPFRQLGGTLSAQGRTTLDFGDVSLFPLEASIRVMARVADVAARPYAFHADFHYTRTIGFWGQTKSARVEPSDFASPEPVSDR